MTAIVLVGVGILLVVTAAFAVNLWLGCFILGVILVTVGLGYDFE